MAILETKNLTYTYGVGTPFEKTAVENVNLSVEKGEFVGVIGHKIGRASCRERV